MKTTLTPDELFARLHAGRYRVTVASVTEWLKEWECLGITEQHLGRRWRLTDRGRWLTEWLDNPRLEEAA